MSSQVFRPRAGGAYSAAIVVTTTSTATRLPGTAPADCEEDLRLYNAGPADVFLRFGTASTIATADGTSLVLPAGNTEVFRLAAGQSHLAAVVAADAATLYLSRGDGD